MTPDGTRRPLASRDSGWARSAARYLAASAVTPNQISGASMVAALIAGAAFWGAGTSEGLSRGILLVLAAAFCQIRLLCNLLDGMVAIEGEKKSPDGGFWNEFPDRVADILILLGAGLCVGSPSLGWAAGCLAVLTAYVRELGAGLGQPPDFSGPMAKQHRMALITVAAMVASLAPLWNGSTEVVALALWAVAIGSGATAVRRAVRLVRLLRT